MHARLALCLIPLRPRVLLPAVAGVVLAASALAGVALAAEELPGPLPAAVLEVVDGDTLRVRVTVWLGQHVEVAVRLDGIDAPELRGRCAAERARAAEARTRLAALVAGRALTLSRVRWDKYGGRVVAHVAADGTDPGAVLRREGLARPYTGTGPRAEWCASATQPDRTPRSADPDVAAAIAADRRRLLEANPGGEASVATLERRARARLSNVPEGPEPQYSRSSSDRSSRYCI